MGFGDFAGLSGDYGFLGVDPAGVMSGEGMAGGEYGTGAQMAADPMDLFGWQAAGREAEAKAIEQQAMGMQKDWMDYIKQEYAPYSEVARMSLAQQAGLAGLGDPGAKEAMISDIESDPFYQAKVRAGEESVLRGASATGGLRSGATSSNLAQINQMLLSKEIEDRYQRLAGLSGQGFMGQQAGTTGGAAALGELTGTMGSMVSGISARQAAASDKQSGLMGLVGGIASMFSDERLKTNVAQIGIKKGLPWYTWEWNDLAGEKFGLHGEAVGFMASDVELEHPECITTKDGYMMVNYGGIT